MMPLICPLSELLLLFQESALRGKYIHGKTDDVDSCHYPEHSIVAHVFGYNAAEKYAKT